MSYETLNLSKVVAEGFFSVYVSASLPPEERQAGVANLAAVLESVFAQGMNRGQMDFTQRLIQRIGVRSEVPAAELLELASKLGAAQSNSSPG